VPQEVHRPGGLPCPAFLNHRGATANQDYKPRLGGGDSVGLDYKSVTLGELTLSLVARCTLWDPSCFGLPSGAAIFRAVSPKKRDQVRLRSRLM
jgi:hypothetical protein